MVMSTPVRMARLSSFDTTRATRRTIEANWANGMSTRWVTSTCGKAGKSSGLSALMENEAVSQVMTAFSSSASTCTAASGRFFTMSANSLPGTTARPGCSTRAATVYWTDSRLQREGVVVRLQEHAGEDGKRRPRGHALEHHAQGVLEFRLVDAEFQGVPFLSPMRVRSSIQYGKHHVPLRCHYKFSRLFCRSVSAACGAPVAILLFKGLPLIYLSF